MSAERRWEIYTLSDPRDGAVRYVGVTHSGKDRRLRDHLARAAMGVANRKYDWMRSLLDAGLKPLWNTAETGTGKAWQDAERKWIAFYHEKGEPLTNVREGGAGAPGVTRSPLTLARMAAAQRGTKRPPRSPEWRARLSAAQKGRQHTPQARAKMSASHTGVKISDEQRAKMIAGIKALPPRPPEWCAAISEGQKGRKHTPESIAKMRAAKLGIKRGPRSEETKAKISAAQIGKPRPPQTPEANAKRSASLRASAAAREAADRRIGSKDTDETRRRKSEARRAYFARLKQQSNDSGVSRGVSAAV